VGLTGHHDPAILVEAMRRFTFDTVLVALNAADVHRRSFIHTVLPEAVSRGIGVIGMKVCAQGRLLGQGGVTCLEGGEQWRFIRALTALTPLTPLTALTTATN
jgi:hypothetical protein